MVGQVRDTVSAERVQVTLEKPFVTPDPECLQLNRAKRHFVV